MLSTTQPHLQPHEEHFKEHSRGVHRRKSRQTPGAIASASMEVGYAPSQHMGMSPSWEGVRTPQFGLWAAPYRQDLFLTQSPVLTLLLHKDGDVSLRLPILAPSFQCQGPPQGSTKIDLIRTKTLRSPSPQGFRALSGNKLKTRC